MLRRILPSSTTTAFHARAFHASASSSAAAAAAAEGSAATAGGLRQAALGLIRGAQKPLHNKEVFKVLEAALPKDVSRRGLFVLF